MPARASPSGVAAQALEEFDSFFAGGSEPVFGGEAGAGRAAEVVLDDANGEGAVDFLEVAVGVAGELVGVGALPPLRGIEVPAQDDGGVGTEVEDSAKLSAGEVDGEGAGLGPAVFEEEVELEEVEAGLHETLDALAGELLPGVAAAGTIGEGVEGGVDRLAAKEKSGLAEGLADFEGRGLGGGKAGGRGGDERGGLEKGAALDHWRQS